MARYFKEGEFACKCCGIEVIDKHFLEKLDEARFMAGVPFVITSGYRCRKHNAEVGGASSSAHRLGKAADIKCTNSRNRFLIIDALIKAGFKRIGVGKDFINADLNETADQVVMWVYD